MDINAKRNDDILQISVKGRLDTFGAVELENMLNKFIKNDDIHVLIDMKDVQYLGGGGIKVFLWANEKLNKKGGDLHLCNINHYSLEVLEMAGYYDLFRIHSGKEEAILHIKKELEETEEINWDIMPQYIHNNIKLNVCEVSRENASLKAVGDISKVLYAQLKPTDIYSRKFSETEYSIGLGALGEDIKDYLDILGEMITIGETMVWLPTDGHDTPDFLIPQEDTGKITIHTGFNVALKGDFNDIIVAESIDGKAFTISTLYAAIFNIARQTHHDFSGVISIAMQADVEEFYSSGVKISPIKKFEPENHEMIMNKDNIKEWIDINNEVKYKGETIVSFGIGMDLTGNLSMLEKEALHTLFYLHPANIGDKEMILHDHAVVFKYIPIKKTPNLDKQIRKVVNKGKFIDMRHLLDTTQIKSAILGVSYITDIIFEDK